MGTTGVEVAAGEEVGAVEGELASTGALEKVGEVGDFLEPSGDGVLADRFLDARLHCAAAESKDHETNQREQDEVKGEEGRVIEAQHDHPDDSREDKVDAVEEEQRRAFLDGQDIEEPVHQFRRMDPVGGRSRDAGESVSEVGGKPDEDPSLDDLGEVMLDGAHEGEQAEKGEQCSRQDDERLNVDLLLAAEGDVVDHRVYGQGNGEVQDAGDDREQDDRPYVGHFRAQQPHQTPMRSGMLFGVGVAVV